MCAEITTIGLDADDTLWHNETFFRLSQERFGEMLAAYADPDHLADRLLKAEVRNLKHYGYGIKGFTLSMIETAIDVTDGKVPTKIIGELVAMGRDMLDHPIDLLPGAQSAVRDLSQTHNLVLITKGDLLHQERKLAQSGLGDHFHGVEIVSEKTPGTYLEAFARHGAGAEKSMMVGNSMRSDVQPALDAGAWGVFVPHELEWAHEAAKTPAEHPRYLEIPDLEKLTALVAEVENS